MVTDDEPEIDESAVEEASAEAEEGFGDLDPDGIIEATQHLGPHAQRVDEGITYDCTEWSGESRNLLQSMLTTAGIPHSWQGTVLGVPEGVEEQVDSIIDEVLAAATPALDATRGRVVYEVGTWSAALQSSLAESLVVADIPYEWDERGDLVVYAEDEERVEEIFDQLPDPDDPELGDDGGPSVQDLLSRLFVAASDLAKKPRDADAVVDCAEVADSIERLSLPFGFESAAWKNLVALATQLRDLLVEEDPDLQPDDEDLKERAAALRDSVRHYV